MLGKILVTSILALQSASAIPTSREQAPASNGPRTVVTKRSAADGASVDGLIDPAQIKHNPYSGSLAKRSAFDDARADSVINSTLIEHNPHSGPLSDSKLNKRFEDEVSTCGDTWISIDDVEVDDETTFIGYESAVEAFCESVSADFNGKKTRVGPKAYAGDTIYRDSADNKVGVSLGHDPNDIVYPGHIEFEIHNKQDTGYVEVERDTCIEYLKYISKPSSKCYGKDHKDTKGGTYQIGKETISYHALAYRD